MDVVRGKADRQEGRERRREDDRPVEKKGREGEEGGGGEGGRERERKD